MDSEYTSPKQSSVVVKNGEPLVVYHGTNAKFNTFHSKSGEYWFSESYDYAEAMMEERGGGEIKEVREMRSSQQMDADYKKQITEADIATLRSIGRKSVDDLTPEDIQKAQKWAYLYKELKVKSLFFRAWFGDWRAFEGKKVSIARIPQYIDSNEERKKNRGAVENEDTSWTISISREGETNTISHAGKERLPESGFSGIKELITHAKLLDTLLRPLRLFVWAKSHLP